MLEVTLAEYTSHLFQEVVRARQLSDLHSKSVARAYASDEVLQHFPVPRFRIPKVTLSIPVVVERATISQLGQVDPDAIISDAIGGIQSMLRLVKQRRPVLKVKAFGEADRPDVAAFVHRVLAEHQTMDLVAASQGLARSFLRSAVASGVGRFVPDDQDKQAAADVGLLIANLCRDALRIDRRGLDALYVNPLTAAVREGGATSVFTLTAELVEEGFYLRTIRDEESGTTRTVVEFD